MVRTHLIGHGSGLSVPDTLSPPVFPLVEHAMVTLSAPLDLDDGRRLPRDARGAIVFVLGEGTAYMVEFVTPFHALATILAADLTPVLTA